MRGAIATRLPFFTLLAWFVGCETTAPPVLTPEIAVAGTRRDVLASTLKAGREVFTTKCVTCHVAQPIPKYSVSEWRGIVGKMAGRAKLSETDRAELLAYLTAVVESSH